MTTLTKIFTTLALALSLTTSALASLGGAAVFEALNWDDKAYGRVNAHSYNTHEITLNGRGLARIAVAGDGDTDLDLYVYDRYGNLVASDDDRTDDCIVSFRPRYAGKYVVKIKNLGHVYNNYAVGID